MARLQDFQSVTPSGSDKLLIVQSQGQGLSEINTVLGGKMDKNNPSGSGKLSLNRKSGSAEGTNSVATGYNCEASGNYSIAENYTTKASGFASHAEGYNTIANHIAQHVFGTWNEEDPSTAAADAKGNYAEIVGNGGSSSSRSNARTLDWNGNEVLAGDVTINGSTSVGTSISNLQTSRAYAYRKTSTTSFQDAAQGALAGNTGVGKFLDDVVHANRNSFSANDINFQKGQVGGEVMFAMVMAYSSNYYCGYVSCYATSNAAYGGLGFVSFQYANGTYAINYISSESL